MKLFNLLIIIFLLSRIKTGEVDNLLNVVKNDINEDKEIKIDNKVSLEDEAKLTKELKKIKATSNDEISENETEKKLNQNLYINHKKDMARNEILNKVNIALKKDNRNEVLSVIEANNDLEKFKSLRKADKNDLNLIVKNKNVDLNINKIKNSGDIVKNDINVRNGYSDNNYAINKANKANNSKNEKLRDNLYPVTYRTNSINSISASNKDNKSFNNNRNTNSNTINDTSSSKNFIGDVKEDKFELVTSNRRQFNNKEDFYIKDRLNNKVLTNKENESENAKVEAFDLSDNSGYKTIFKTNVNSNSNSNPNIMKTIIANHSTITKPIHHNISNKDNLITYDLKKNYDNVSKFNSINRNNNGENTINLNSIENNNQGFSEVRMFPNNDSFITSDTNTNIINNSNKISNLEVPLINQNNLDVLNYPIINSSHQIIKDGPNSMVYVLNDSAEEEYLKRVSNPNLLININNDKINNNQNTNRKRYSTRYKYKKSQQNFEKENGKKFINHEEIENLQPEYENNDALEPNSSEFDIEGKIIESLNNDLSLNLGKRRSKLKNKITIKNVDDQTLDKINSNFKKLKTKGKFLQKMNKNQLIQCK